MCHTSRWALLRLHSRYVENSYYLDSKSTIILRGHQLSVQELEEWLRLCS
jgi:hypothetical protein